MENLKTASEAFPFFSQYGHYLIFTTIVSVVLNLLLNSWRKGEQFKNPRGNEEIDTKEKELTPDEGKFL